MGFIKIESTMKQIHTIYFPQLKFINLLVILISQVQDLELQDYKWETIMLGNRKKSALFSLLPSLKSC